MFVEKQSILHVAIGTEREQHGCMFSHDDIAQST
jgi:hypothetical protein